MNTHVQLIRDSIIAPRAAVDLARQHPDTTRLARTYVVATVVLSILFDLVWAKFFAAETEAGLDGSSIIDSRIFWAIAAAFSFVLSYVLMKWYWSRVAPPGTAQDAINAAIACSFAISLVLLIPQYVAIEIQDPTSAWTFLLLYVGLLSFSFAFTVLYFSHALKITIGHSFLSNVSLLFLTILVTFVIAAVLVLVGYFVGLIFNVSLLGIPVS
jgi:hypothetical protein